MLVSRLGFFSSDRAGRQIDHSHILVLPGLLVRSASPPPYGSLQEDGYNAVQFWEVYDCWAKDIGIVNPDSGFFIHSEGAGVGEGVGEWGGRSPSRSLPWGCFACPLPSLLPFRNTALRCRQRGGAH